jgi:hypothetical protein
MDSAYIKTTICRPSTPLIPVRPLARERPLKGVGGEVQLDANEVPNHPGTTLAEAERLRAAGSKPDAAG